MVTASPGQILNTNVLYVGKEHRDQKVYIHVCSIALPPPVPFRSDCSGYALGARMLVGCRVVIFDSRLLHKSDQFLFKKGYENRR